MKETLTYKYYIKETSQSDTSYVQKGTNTTGSYTFDKLTQGTSYDIKVEVEEDKAGNIGTAYLANQITGSLPGGEEGIEQGAIQFSDPVWENGKAQITISTNTDLKIQYQKNTTSGNWLEIANGGKVTELENTNTVYARLTDGTNYGEYASVIIEDTVEPTINSFEATEIKWNRIKVQVNAVDEESGLVSTNTYKFYLNDETIAKGTSTDGTYTYTDLNGFTNYKLRVEVYDNVGNMAEKEISITTKQPTAEEVIGIIDITDREQIYVKIPNIKKRGDQAQETWTITYPRCRRLVMPTPKISHVHAIAQTFTTYSSLEFLCDQASKRFRINSKRY